MIIYPAFKFLKRGYKDNFLNSGEVLIGTLHDFRDENKFIKGISDPLEGKIAVRKYDCLEEEYVLGLSDVNPSSSQEVELDDCYLYCATSRLFTNTLSTLQSYGYDSCVMILYPGFFFKTISNQLPELTPLDHGECKYINKTINSFKNSNNSIDKAVIDDSIRAVFLKPRELESQMEYRFAWKSSVEKTSQLEPILQSFDGLSKSLLEIDISELGDFQINSNYGVTVEIIKINDEIARIGVIRPCEVFSPVIVLGFSEELYLGFMSESRPLTYEVTGLENNDANIPTNEHGVIIACNRLADIKGIKIIGGV